MDGPIRRRPVSPVTGGSFTLLGGWSACQLMQPSLHLALSVGSLTDEQCIAAAETQIRAKCDLLWLHTSYFSTLQETGYDLPYFVPLTSKEVDNYRSIYSADPNHIIDKFPRTQLTFSYA